MMRSMFLHQKEKYDGTQLASLRNYLRHGLLGDSIVSWVGSCDIPAERMVDGEDLRAHAVICGSEMLHFIVEKFETSLFTAVVLQRLLASIALEQLRLMTKEFSLRREGDDLYKEQRKLSISVATQSPVSSLIHFAVNVKTAGTPVPTLSLEDMRVEPPLFAEQVMAAFRDEVESMLDASRKVNWVK